MKKENIIKAALIFGGGYLLFLLVKAAREKNSLSTKTADTNTKTSTEVVKSFDSVIPEDAPTPNPEKAPIVMEAYIAAMNAGEPPMRLTELNKECMKDFGMRCYVSDDGKVVVCDIKGNTILSQ